MMIEARTAGLIGALTAALVSGACGGEQPPASTAAPPAPASAPAQTPDATVASEVPFTPPPPSYAGELPPLPANPYPAPRPPEVIEAAYAFAARHPEVLHYVPCFCGCQRSGHSDNHDCFIKRREANGRPVWDDHGMT